MRPKTISLTGSGTTTTNSAIVPLNHRVTPFNVGLGFDTDGSTTGFTVQYSFDNPEGDYATDYGTNAKWFDHPDLAAMTADAEGNIAFPVRAVRLQADSNGTDTGELTIIQAWG